MDYQKLLDDISKNEASLSKNEASIQKNINAITDNVTKINFKFISIAVEKSIAFLPEKANGSVKFSKDLNKLSDKFDENRFNKIVRFLSLLENIEEDYNKSYKSIARNYIKKDQRKEVEILIDKLALLNDEYSLMNFLLTAIDSDKVLYNKIYNKLEDRGVFMTTYDKQNFKNLSEIAYNMRKLVDQGRAMNRSLQMIAYEMYEMNSSLSDANEKLNGIHGAVKAGNALKAIQTYQLYKANKKLS